MRLHQLEVTAFGPFSGTEKVDFDAVGSAGLFLLHGPTGAGKTTVLDAVCFALFGQVPGSRGSARQRLRSDHAPADREPRVRLELTLAGRRLEVVRSPEWQRPKRRGQGTTKAQASTTVRELVDGAWTPLTSRNDEAGHLLQQLVGMGVEQFTKVVLLPQGEFAAFLRADAETRRSLLSRLFEIDHYTGVEEWLAEERRRSAREVETADRRTDELVSRAVEAAAGLPDDEPPAEGAASDVDVTDAALFDAAEPAADEQKPLLVVAELVQRAEVATRNGDARLVRCEERLAAGRHASAVGATVAEHQQRLATVTTRLTELDARAELLEADRARLAAARRAVPLGPLLVARQEAVERWTVAADDASRAVAAPVLADWLATITGLAGVPSTTHRGLEDLAAAHAHLLATLPDATTCDQRRSALEGRRGSLKAAVARLDARRAITTEIARLAAAVVSAEENRDEAVQLREAARRDQELVGAQLDVLRTDLPDLQVRDDAAARARTVVQLAQEHSTVLHQLDAASSRCRQAVDDDQQARDRYLQVRERRLEGIAAELAMCLEAGAPCPVCGSSEHPQPSIADDEHVDRAVEIEAARSADLARAEREQAASALAELQARSAELSALSGGLDLPAAREALLLADAQLVQAQKQHARYAQLVDAHADAGSAVERFAARATTVTEQLGEHSSSLAEARGRLRSVDDQLRSLLDAADEPLAEAADDDLGAQIVRCADELGEQLTALSEVTSARGRLEVAFAAFDGAQQQLERTAHERGFDEVDEAAAALLPMEQVDQLSTSVESRDRQRAELVAERNRPELVEAAAQPAPDLAALTSALERSESELRRATAEHAVAQRSAASLRRLHAELSAHELQSDELRQRFARLDELSRCVDGTGGGNSLRMRLSAYVLAARLEQVAAAATERLDVMSGGRYALVHSDEVVKGGGRSGLTLRVVDGWTGVERDTATLSGGESFLASLALALGLADVVQAEAGGAGIETLFVDEGFGTLDDETLDEVMAVLDGLRDGGRTVGVVSHVAELRQRIPSRIEVVKRRDGSRLVAHDVGA
jgi:exonuclease SbcC